MNKKQKIIEQRILNYLHKNPDAKSTLKVIASEWVRTEYIEEAVEEVAEVLDRLMEEGVIESLPVKGNNPVYKISTKHINDLKITGKEQGTPLVAE